MKMRYIKTDLLLKTWLAGVDTVLFPPALIAELRPETFFEQPGFDLPGEREKNRARVDALIARLIDSDTPQILHEELRKTEPSLTALYYDRIQAATFALEQRPQDQIVEIPDSWYELVRLLLHQKLFRSCS